MAVTPKYQAGSYPEHQISSGKAARHGHNNRNREIALERFKFDAAPSPSTQEGTNAFLRKN
jgi:hypothetical protein